MRSHAAWLGFALLLGGCSAESHKLVDSREIGDKVAEVDLETFLEVIDELPDKKLPEMPVLFKGPPAWDDHRTLPVNELLADETDELEKLWNDEMLLRHFARDRVLQKALRQRLSLHQFVGLVKTIGVALSRNAVRPEQDLPKIIEEGKKHLDRLRTLTLRFNELKPDERHVVLMTAVWVTRIDRSRRLLQVPPENRALAKAHFERLKDVFPKEFTANPFDSITNPIEERGMTFQELPQTGLDAEIEWSESEAIRGTDPPDHAAREATASTAAPPPAASTTPVGTN